MSDETKIEWAEHTGGPYLGCTEVSPGCAHCYARELALTRLEPIFRRAYKLAAFEDWETRPVWGKNATRVLSKGFWNDARRLNAAHEKAGTRGRWFPSMIDWLDDMAGGIIDQEGNKLDPIEVLARFLKLVFETPHLDWLLLTKRPENFNRLEEIEIRSDGFGFWLLSWLGFKQPPENVWIGASAEDQKRADERIPELLKIPAKIRFLSCEPLLGPITLPTKAVPIHDPEYGDQNEYYEALRGIHWVIVGGESGPGARPCSMEWIRGIVCQCQEVRVKVFVKQLGSRPVEDLKDARGHYCGFGPVTQKHKKGGDPEEWPADLRVREFPERELRLA